MPPRQWNFPIRSVPNIAGCAGISRLFHRRTSYFAGIKAFFLADYLIDDTYRHFERFRGQGILFSAPHNVAVTGCRRVANWREVEELFLPVGRA